MTGLEDSLKPFRDFADAVIDLFRKERSQSDYVLTGWPVGRGGDGEQPGELAD